MQFEVCDRNKPLRHYSQPPRNRSFVNYLRRAERLGSLSRILTHVEAVIWSSSVNVFTRQAPGWPAYGAPLRPSEIPNTTQWSSAAG